MKKIAVTLSTVAVIAVGGVLGATQLSDNAPKTENTAEASGETKEVVEVPKERTVNIPVEGVPQNHMTSKEIKDLQDEGEVVYLLSDAQVLEDYTVNMANMDAKELAQQQSNDLAKKEMAESAVNYLQAFAEGVSPYVDNQAYFNKLKEVEQALLNEQYDQVPALIEEAKTLRES